MRERRLLSLPDGSIVDALVGYRAWFLLPEDGHVHLISLTPSRGKLFRWPQKWPVEAECRCATIHTCGIYAWDAPHRLQTTPLVSGVRGEVALWGDPIDIHELGYRARFALPVALYLDGAVHEGLVQTAALQYDIPVVRV